MYIYIYGLYRGSNPESLHQECAHTIGLSVSGLQKSMILRQEPWCQRGTGHGVFGEDHMTPNCRHISYPTITGRRSMDHKPFKGSFSPEAFAV